MLYIGHCSNFTSDNVFTSSHRLIAGCGYKVHT